MLLPTACLAKTSFDHSPNSKTFNEIHQFLWQWKIYGGSFPSSVQTLKLAGDDLLHWISHSISSEFWKIGSFTWFKSSPFMTNPLIPSNLQGIWQVEQPRGNAKSTGLLRMPDWKAQLLRIRSFWITGGSWNQQKLGETAGSDGDLKKTSTWLPLVNRRLFQRTVMDPRTSDPTGPKSHGPKRIGFCCWWSDDRWKKTPVKWSSWNYPAR